MNESIEQKDRIKDELLYLIVTWKKLSLQVQFSIIATQRTN